MFKKLFVIMFCFVFVVACKLSLPTSDSHDTEDINAVRAVWDPYICVHPFGIAAQQQHLEKLIRAGALRSVRMGNLHILEVQRFAAWLQGRGVEVLGIFDNEHLRARNVCMVFSQHLFYNPGILTWEIGNEVNGSIGMSPKEYMQISTLLFSYAKRAHPDIRLAIGAVAGNGSSADDLRRMIDAGLDRLCRDGLEIVPIHFYSWRSSRLAEFQSQIARLPISTRIWVTETNDLPPHWNTQIGYVTEMYPRLRTTLRAERIYWYVFSESSDFALVTGLGNGGEAAYSPLMNALIGVGVVDDNAAAFDDLGIPPEILPMLPDLKRGDKPQHIPRERERRSQ